ncbi:MAG: CoA transferase, partial [Pseudomonadota bacterium]
MEQLKPGPLSGVTVLDFTWVLAGPFATRTLADMGAYIIKVERYKDGTNERHLPLIMETKDGVKQSSYNINCNRGKKSICVNLKDPQGREIIHDLIRKSDVLIENFAPGVMDRLKLDYESVKKIKEDIIYCSVSCFGHWGPYSHKPGYDMIAQGASGWTDQSEIPQIAPVSIGDMNA